MHRQTICYIDLECLRHNVAQVRRLIGDIPQMVMVKANGYGHGIVEVSEAVTQAGAHMLGVAMAEEGVLLRENGINAPILIVGPLCSPGEVIKYNLRQAVCSVSDVKSLQQAAMETGGFALVHIKVDTGMNRIGAKHEQELSDILDELKRSPAVIAEGIFTHFSSADTDEEYTRMQAERFKKACELAEGRGFKLFRHAANSAATLLYPEYRYDFVRLGIIIYGYSPGGILASRFKPALSLKAGISFIKDIDAGESVSYNRSFIADKPMRTATITAGYGDGYKRAMSNNGYVLINGKRAPILGNICMDQMMVDVTDIPEAKVGGEAVLLGESGAESVWAEELARRCNTISYEIMLSITGRVPKVYLNG
ncbi:MAG TPA: alanine racemase [Clostridia bacterium]|nr:alanine racemase [Clostridia bacterium]